VRSIAGQSASCLPRAEFGRSTQEACANALLIRPANIYQFFLPVEILTTSEPDSGEIQIGLAWLSAGAHISLPEWCQQKSLSARPTGQPKLRLRSVHTVAARIEELDPPAESADVVVSSYALHRLHSAAKARLAAAAFSWLKPDGRLVLAESMGNAGRLAGDRPAVTTEGPAVAGTGPGGLRQLVRNGLAPLFRRQSSPVSVTAWADLLDRSHGELP
jgi:SAM-dependent methyltransferase